MNDYQEKLLKPKWQKVRLRVFERDDWKCQLCGDEENTLCVHHLYYTQDTEPWDYPMEAFKTLCVDCHEREKEAMNEAITQLTQTIKSKGFLSSEAQDLCDAIENMVILKDLNLQLMAVQAMLHDESLIKRWMKKMFSNNSAVKEEQREPDF